MRITYVTETFTPQINGLALTAERTLRHLRGAGHQVELLRPRQGGEAPCNTLEEWRTAGLSLPLKEDVHWGLASSDAIRRRWHLAGQPPDVVHVATCGPLAWAALTAARAEGLATSADLRLPLLASESPPDQSRSHCSWLSALQFEHLERLHRLADCSFVPTREIANQLAARGFENLQVLGRGVDGIAFSPHWRDGWLRRDWRAREHHPVLLYVGLLAVHKNAELALQTFEQLRLEKPSLRMIVVGDGPLRRELQARHPRVRFAGWQTGTELARHYASADVCLFPSLTESFGSITLEAMASGLALVAFDRAAAGLHVADGKTGFLARPAAGEAAARHFVDAARKALAAAEPEHPLRQQARVAALRADWHATLSVFERRLHRVASHTPSAPRGLGWLTNAEAQTQQR